VNVLIKTQDNDMNFISQQIGRTGTHSWKSERTEKADTRQAFHMLLDSWQTVSVVTF